MIGSGIVWRDDGPKAPARSLYAVVSVGGVSTVRVNDAPKAPARSLYAVVSVGGVSTVGVSDAPKAPARSLRFGDAETQARTIDNNIPKAPARSRSLCGIFRARSSARTK